jgi:CheY-like chemotaxis protein
MPIEVLLVEDSPGDVRLTKEAFRGADVNLHVASDGVEALAFLSRQGPMLHLLARTLSCSISISLRWTAARSWLISKRTAT